uniref:G_PROTEIN_RECEP_F1_2 domain-containing protein n=2 Tax=Bursaphelenchus xylophilus TaxID=6326 RepID=A0A1I7SRN3_BURXY
MIFLALISPIAGSIKGIFGRKGLQLSKHLAKMRTEISLGLLAITAAFHWLCVPAWMNWGVWLRPAINIRPQITLVHRCKSEPCLGSAEKIENSEAPSKRRSFSANFESNYDFGMNLRFKNPVLDNLFDPMDTVTTGLDAIGGLGEPNQVKSEESVYASARSTRWSKEMVENGEDSMI